MNQAATKHKIPSVTENWAAYLLVLVIAIPTFIYLLFVPAGPKRTVKEGGSVSALTEVKPFLVSDDGDPEELLQAVAASLSYLERLNSATSFQFGRETTSVEHLHKSLSIFQTKLKEMGLSPEFSAYVHTHFRFFKSTAPKVTFTGYFLPQLRGSLTQSPVFSYPLYRRPDDLLQIKLSGFPTLAGISGLPETVQGRLTADNTVVPYFSRDQIDHDGALENKKLELVWLEDPIAAFFLHIQGSGEVLLQDGSRLTLGYADKNGHPYRPIGKLLLDQGAIPKGEVSMQSIAAYLRKHPEQQREIFRYNPSYVFFRILKEGPVGNIQVPLTAYRSIATDYRLFPKGGLALVRTKLPTFNSAGTISGWQEHVRFVLNQDTGGAIRGPGRVDLYTGAGTLSELTAGYLNQGGDLYFLLLK